MGDSCTSFTSMTNEVEHRKRKQAMDRAKANYLCGQLRLRLQYAKLKVEYGWQRNNLNEVENLFFRHTQKRQSLLNNHPSPLFARPAGFGSSSAYMNTLKLQLQSLERVETSADPNPDQTGNAHGTAAVTSASQPPLQSKEPPMASLQPSSSQIVQAKHTSPSPPLSTTSAPSSYRPPSILTPVPSYMHSSPASGDPLGPTSSTTLPHSSAQYLSKAYVSSSPFPVNMPTTGSGSPSASMFGAHNQALTYDSFWSSHSTWSATASAVNAAANRGGLGSGSKSLR